MEYLSRYATIYDALDIVTFEEGSLLDLEEIAIHCCADNHDAPVWLAARIRRQLMHAMMDPKIKEEIAHVVRYGDIQH